jgi:hypothetical protein
MKFEHLITNNPPTRKDYIIAKFEVLTEDEAQLHNYQLGTAIFNQENCLLIVEAGIVEKFSKKSLKDAMTSLAQVCQDNKIKKLEFRSPYPYHTKTIESIIKKCLKNTPLKIILTEDFY